MDRITNTKTARKATANTGAAHASPEDHKVHAADNPDLFAWLARVSENISDRRRVIFAAIAGLVTTIVSGFASVTLVEWLMVGAATAGVGVFLQMAIFVIGCAIALWFAAKTGARVAGAVITGEADDRARAAYASVKSVLTRFNPFVKLEPVPARARV